ncbi:uncharacterized protein [Rutidosis leptorrhynchoides]|uniref:uncharacterized protein n=1 Tax=Rutidosis leptorrhynchoides TaxID=125765 RepID=UPI003A9930B0
MVDGPVTTCNSYDSATPHANGGGAAEMLYPTEYLNSLNYPGLSPHVLNLKVGVPSILLRNINVTGGLCNGTRMIITQLLTKSVEAEIIMGTRVGEKVFFLRMKLIHKEPSLPFVLKRLQFPIIFSYAMTIQKSRSITQEDRCLFTKTRLWSRAIICCTLKSYFPRSMAQITALAQLISGDRNRTIAARIYQKWVTYSYHIQAPTGYCCMLIDEMNYPKLVNMRYGDKDFLDNLMHLNKVYMISNFEMSRSY